MKKAIPIGFCKDCRWSRDLPQDLHLGPFTLDCRGLPAVYQGQEERGPGVVDPITGRKMTRLAMVYMAQHKKPDDFCALFAPAGGVEEPGLLDGGG